jgi:signal transduction histidine kinase
MSLQSFIDLNSDIISFIYGLTFFALGVVIHFQSRHYSRLDLARSLTWLATFGLLHGIYIWAELFSPIQERYLSPTGVEILHTLHLVVLGLSFICLFEFGVTLLRPLGRLQWLGGVSIGILVIWTIVCFLVIPRLTTDLEVWHSSTEALARYFIGFPAALLAAYGLRQQTVQRIAPLHIAHIYDTLRVAGIALAFYAFFGGLIPPAVPFFPGNVLNETTFEQAFGFPPSLVQMLIGLIMVIMFFRALEVFDVETARLIEAMEQQQILAAERDRIARELHDGVIQKVYTAGLLVESAQKQAEPQSVIAGRLETAVTVLNDAIRDLRRNIGELRTAPSGETLPKALHRLADDPRFRSLMDISLDLDLPEADVVSPDRAEHVLAIATEAMSNVARHAHARNVEIAARVIDGRLKLTIQDDGSGLPANIEPGYGLRNMRDRARLLDGELEVAGANGKGTVVKLDIPVKDER